MHFILLLTGLLAGVEPPTLMVYGLTETAVAELARRPDLRGWALVAAPKPVRTEGIPGDVRRLAVQGKSEYHEMLYEEAALKLDRAVESLGKLALQPGDWPLYLDTLLYAALAQEALGKTAEADGILVRYARLSPEGAPGAEFPAPFRARIAAHQQALPSRRGSLRIESSPPGAQAYLDGQARGPTPLTLAGLTGDEHTVSLALDGFETATKRVSVRPGFGIGADATPDLVEITLRSAAAEPERAAREAVARGGLPDAVTTRALERVLASRQAGGAFFVATAPGGQLAALLTAGGWSGPAPAPKPGERLSAWLHKVPSAATVPPVPVAAKGSSRRWVWAALGVAVTGAVTAALLAAEPAPAGPSTGSAVIRW